MSDALRTRISDIARDHFDASCACPGVPEMRSYRDACDHVADVLIRELGWTQQYLVDGIISDGEPRPWELPCETRYATEWERFDG